LFRYELFTPASETTPSAAIVSLGKSAAGANNCPSCQATPCITCIGCFYQLRHCSKSKWEALPTWQVIQHEDKVVGSSNLSRCQREVNRCRTRAKTCHLPSCAWVWSLMALRRESWRRAVDRESYHHTEIHLREEELSYRTWFNQHGSDWLVCAILAVQEGADTLFKELCQLALLLHRHYCLSESTVSRFFNHGFPIRGGFCKPNLVPYDKIWPVNIKKAKKYIKTLAKIDPR